MTDLAEVSDAVAIETSVASACYPGKINVIQPSHKLHVS